MGFYEYWHEREAKRVAEYQASIEQAHSWIGCRVWVSSMFKNAPASYGEVESVDERGMVRILVGYASDDDRPLYQTVSANMLASSVVLADES